MQLIYHEDEHSDTLVQMKVILIWICVPKHGANCKNKYHAPYFQSDRLMVLIKCKRKFLK
jgi:hypothetical protein